MLDSQLKLKIELPWNNFRSDEVYLMQKKERIKDLFDALMQKDLRCRIGNIKEVKKWLK